MNFRPKPVGQTIVFCGLPPLHYLREEVGDYIVGQTIVFCGLPPLHCLREEVGGYIVGQTIVFCGLPLGLPPWETAGRRHKTIVCPTEGRQ